VRQWYDEISEYDPRNPVDSHYTQVVWASTTEVGCGIARCERSAVVVCQYRPSGGYDGYEKGGFAKNVSPPDTNKGLTYARTNCAECHAVSNDTDLSPNSDAPRFVDLDLGNDRMVLKVTIRAHGTMPVLVVPDADMDNLIDYIQSLRRPR
jgi:hypothetical protein